MPVGSEHRYCIDWPFYYAGSVVNKAELDQAETVSTGRGMRSDQADLIGFVRDAPAQNDSTKGTNTMTPIVKRNGSKQ